MWRTGQIAQQITVALPCPSTFVAPFLFRSRYIQFSPKNGDRWYHKFFWPINFPALLVIVRLQKSLTSEPLSRQILIRPSSTMMFPGESSIDIGWWVNGLLTPFFSKSLISSYASSETTLGKSGPGGAVWELRYKWQMPKLSKMPKINVFCLFLNDRIPQF
jgi:hypothetical protein